MTNKIQEAFTQYTEKLKNLSQRVAILPDKKRHLGDLVKDIEESSEFHALVQATSAEFGHTGNYRNESAWQRAVGNVLRRSGYYINILEKKLHDVHDVSAEFEKYIHAFRSSERKISYLALLEYVSFEQGYYSRQDDIDCGHFQIKRFSRDELDAVLGNSINEIFYPWAVVDLDQITDYWFIFVQQTITVTEIVPPANLGIKGSRLKLPARCPLYSRIERTYIPRPFPELLEPVIKLLALFDWPTSYGWGGVGESAEGWNRFNIPLVLTVTDSLYKAPNRTPPFERLWKEMEFDQTGNEIGEYPVILISLNEQETESLITFVKRTHEILQKLDFEKYEWHFFEIALDMFVKAFFADGLEQLLWHITAIEALLGERGRGLKEKLARRTASILGRTDRERNGFYERFRKLYVFRSDLVHGNQFKEDVYSEHLRED